MGRTGPPGRSRACAQPVEAGGRETLNQDRARLRAIRDLSRETLLRLVGRSRWVQRGIALFGVIAGPILLGVASGMSGGFEAADASGLTWKGVMAIGGAILASLGGLLSLLVQEAASDALLRSERLEGEAQAFLDERDAFSARLLAGHELDGRRLALIEAARTMLETAAASAGTSGLDADVSIEFTLRAARRALVSAIDFDRDEYWAISIFRVEGDVLKRMFALRADPAEEQRPGRSWERGEGFVGMSWLRDAEVIVADCINADVAAAYVVPERNRVASDDRRYRSMAVVPVRVGSGDSFWGAVAVSSDQRGRFRKDPDEQKPQNVETVRLMALMIELIVTRGPAGTEGPVVDEPRL